jgi:hypothetical protein
MLLLFSALLPFFPLTVQLLNLVAHPVGVDVFVPLLKVNYHRIVLRIRSADQTPCLLTESLVKEKVSWSAYCLLV